VNDFVYDSGGEILYILTSKTGKNKILYIENFKLVDI
jgi:hypothetical protein